VANIGFLAVDIYFAHAVNQFAEPGEWIPFVFSLAAAPILVLAALTDYRGLTRRAHARVGALVGILAILVGVTGLLYHLQSQFFEQISIKSLVYTAPFVAPLAYTGLGFLLLLDRMVPSGTTEWGQWVLFLAWGGFVGNFVLSLADHAQNGFFYMAEWIPVAAAAFAVSFLLLPLMVRVRRGFLKTSLGLMALQAVVGVLGFFFHVRADVGGRADELFDNLVYGAPVFAPLLFANLALLAAIGLWDMLAKCLEAPERASRSAAA